MRRKDLGDIAVGASRKVDPSSTTVFKPCQLLETIERTACPLETRASLNIPKGTRMRAVDQEEVDTDLSTRERGALPLGLRRSAPPAAAFSTISSKVALPLSTPKTRYQRVIKGVNPLS